MSDSIEARLRELGYELPPPPAPLAAYVPTVRTGNLVFVSGQGPRRADGTMITGKVGRDLSEEQGQEAARACILNCLAQLKAELGSLDRVRRIVKLLGMVNSTPEFDRHPWVINGASQLLEQVLGDRGKHARSAVGMAALPQQIAVEIELIAEAE